MASMPLAPAVSNVILGQRTVPSGAGPQAAGQKPARRPVDYSRVQVCDLHRTFSTQPFMLSELPETVPEPL